MASGGPLFCPFLLSYSYSYSYGVIGFGVVYLVFWVVYFAFETVYLGIWDSVFDIFEVFLLILNDLFGISGGVFGGSCAIGIWTDRIQMMVKKRL